MSVKNKLDQQEKWETKKKLSKTVQTIWGVTVKHVWRVCEKNELDDFFDEKINHQCGCQKMHEDYSRWRR